ncbi:MAG: O-antigen ligase family protein [Acidimicrobiales bacterium]
MSILSLDVATSAPAIVASRPALGERVTAAAMVFFLAYSTPSQWFTEQFNATAIETDAPPDPLALLIILAFGGFFATRMTGNWKAAWWTVRSDHLLWVFLSFLALSSLWSANPLQTIREAIVLLIVAFWGIYLVCRFNLRQIVSIVAAGMAVGVLLDLIWVVALPRFGETSLGWSGVHDNKNGLGRIQVLGASSMIFNARLNRRYRLPSYVVAAISVVLAVGSNSKTSLVSLILLLGVMMIVQGFRARKTLYGAVILAFLTSGIAALGFATANLGPITEALGKDITLTGRTELWTTLVADMARRPFSGWGWNAYWGGYFSPSHEIWVEFNWTPPHGHNALVDYVLEIGVIGAALFLAMFMRGVVRATRHVQTIPGPTGLWPLAMFAFAFLFSITEKGVITRSAFFLVLVVASATASINSQGKDERSRDDQVLP